MNEAVLSRIRIVSGFILFAYVLIHFSNHALGLISLDVMGPVAGMLEKFWRLPPITIILYGALAAHFLSALLRVYQRRSLRMPAGEWAQLLLGLAIPFLMVTHVMSTRYAVERYGIDDTYAYVLLSTFVFSPYLGWMNAAGLVAAWVHGCLGLHFWARLKRWYTPRLHQAGLVFAAALPLLSLTGYLSAGREIIPLASDGDFMGAYYERLNLSSDAVWTWLARDTEWVKIALMVVIGGVIAARINRDLLQRRNREITVDYLDGPKLQLPAGASLLDMSKLGGVPHASVCGGRGRCSTCRVRIITPDADIEPASEAERKVLERVRAPEDVRLACQIHPRTDLQVMRLLPSDATMANAAGLEPWSTGREKVIAVMFADLRDFTRTSESRLPFDVVYLINQFSQTMGKAVEDNGGRIDKFLGDGFMALFGVDGSAEKGARSALEAAQAMMQELGALNERLASDLDEPLRMGIGVHTGSVILGDMGYGNARGLTAIGDTVNTASRLEAATKTEGCALCVSVDAIVLAGITAPDDTRRSISVRGKKNKFEIHALQDTSSLRPATEKAAM